MCGVGGFRGLVDFVSGGEGLGALPVWRPEWGDVSGRAVAVFVVVVGDELVCSGLGVARAGKRFFLGGGRSGCV